MHKKGKVVSVICKMVETKTETELKDFALFASLCKNFFLMQVTGNFYRKGRKGRKEGKENGNIKYRMGKLSIFDD